MSAGMYERIDVVGTLTPNSLRGWGSPTILVNGDDVAGQARGDGVGCRIYDTSNRVPSAAMIAAAIRNSIRT
jgi:hypothetical protein